MNKKLFEILSQEPVIKMQENGSWSFEVCGCHGDHYNSEIAAYATALEVIIEEAKKELKK